ncbi:MAG: hypothetical protein AVO39_05155 [delta proteobacterium MLS_D]|jgi:aldehyde:ferredoxin oxidoreductase|nr:MAG: hypothetical protein AVO39_05155 [delta proteobacterium MLS_D]
MFGYMGKILYCDLTGGTHTVETLEESFARKYLGGNGFAAAIIHRLVSPQIDPLSPDNIVVFASGPVNGTPLWGAGRGHAATISPQTGLFFDSNFGGNFGWMMKRAGFDAYVIMGAASSPVYIMVDEGNVEIRDASLLWGRGAGETHEQLRGEHGGGIESAVIGPAGENGVVYANIVCSGSRVSVAGRGGIGAVLGSKKCKALVLRGKEGTSVARPVELKNEIRRSLPGLREKAKQLTDFGTPVLVKIINDRGRLGTRNNTKEVFDGADAVSGEVIAKLYKRKNIACHGCPVACGKLVDVPTGDCAGRTVKMPEYETIYAMGSMLENSDPVSIFNGNVQCDEMGMDTISFGVTLAFVAECLERGIISPGELGGDIRFGVQRDLSGAARETALRQGAGRLFALGSQELAKRFGKNAEKLLYCSRGLEIPGHSARGLRNMGLAYATSTRGGSHHDARPDYSEPETDPGFDGQPDYTFQSQNNTVIGDSLVICRFVQERVFGTVLNESYLPVVNVITGWNMTLEELERIAERIYTLERFINIRREAGRYRDSLPWRVMNEPIPEGPSRGRFCPRDDLYKMLAAYYRLRGWDEQGNPTEAVLQKLGIESGIT